MTRRPNRVRRASAITAIAVMACVRAACSGTTGMGRFAAHPSRVGLGRTAAHYGDDLPFSKQLVTAVHTFSTKGSGAHG